MAMLHETKTPGQLLAVGEGGAPMARGRVNEA